MELSELFADKAAIAIDNARIFQEREEERIALEKGITTLNTDIALLSQGDLRPRITSQHPRLQPDIELVRHLRLDEKLVYAPIPESFELKNGLARIVGLPEDSRLSEITEMFNAHAGEFLKDVQVKNVLSPVNWGRVSLTEFAH